MKNKPVMFDMRYAHIDNIQNPSLEGIQRRLKQYVQAHSKQGLPYDCLVAPFDAQEMHFIQQQVDIQMTKAAYAALVIIGIGGSHLGIQAVQQLLHGVSSPAFSALYYVDMLDPDRLQIVIESILLVYKDNKEVLVIIISKSGSTIESIANASVILGLMSPQQIALHVVCITDQDSPLHEWARVYGVRTLYIPKAVGGRFSVFTAVGLFPLACMGIDIEQLCAGACKYDWQSDYAALEALWLYDGIVDKAIPIHDLFINTFNAYSLGLWHRQLMAETLGKQKNGIQDNVSVGIMPTVSVISADLHSVGQLYLAGPHVRLTTFLTVPFYKDFSVENHVLCAKTGNLFLKDKGVATIQDAIINGTMETYADQGLPFMHIAIEKKSAFCIGQFMYGALIKTIYTALLLDINPFDQPEVELYKKRAREQLKK